MTDNYIDNPTPPTTEGARRSLDSGAQFPLSETFNSVEG